MSGKRALIVDDSRSARVILSRMLEGYGLQIDAVEAAEQALEFLKQNKPDVIFMDHLMPGMDGFQAIQAIKSNPLTSMIPVMMYTSQEGELYVSQARALGAVGVLPKTVKQTELSRILYQLRLLPERRDPRLAVRPTREQPETVVADEIPTVQIDAPARVTAGEIETAIRNAIGPALQEQNVEIRRFFASSLDAFARRLQSDARPPASPPAEGTVVIEEALAAPPPPAPRPRWLLVAAIAAAVALVPTIVLAVLYTQTLQATTRMMESNARLSSLVEEQQAQLATLQQSAKAAAALADQNGVGGSLVESEAVPYGEAPLAGARIERLREMLGKLKSQGFRGRLRVATYVGEFCLTGNGIEGYSIAADELPIRRCDLVGNPFDDSLQASQRQSLAFANLVSTIKQQTADAVTIEVSYAGRKPSVPYPDGESLGKATAGDWNRIAAQNNRVEFAALPTG